MSQRPSPITLRTSPHLHAAPSVPQIMRQVVLAMLPLCAWSVWQYGLSALLLLLVVVGTCLATEHLFARRGGLSSGIADYSATITGILLALTLPPGFPLWMGAVAGFVAIALGKALFGGLGYNLFNPALVGRAFVQAAFPVAITSWVPAFAPDRFTSLVPSTLAWPLMSPAPITDWLSAQGLDAFSGATPLALHKFQGITTPSMDLLLGFAPGSAGEGPALLILIGGAYLVLRGMMDWRIPAAMIASAWLLAGALHLWQPDRFPDPSFVILSGGLLLGAVFMASDMVASPVTPLGVVLYGAFIGLVTVVIRAFGGLPEGVMYAILLGNAVSPLISRISARRIYGQSRGEDKA